MSLPLEVRRKSRCPLWNQGTIFQLIFDFTSVLLWFIYIYHTHYLSLWPVHKEKVMELKGYQGSSNCGCSILLCHFETRLNAAIMRIKKTIISYTSRVTNVNISIIFNSLTVGNHDSRGFNIHVACGGFQRRFFPLKNNFATVQKKRSKHVWQGGQ